MNPIWLLFVMLVNILAMLILAVDINNERVPWSGLFFVVEAIVCAGWVIRLVLIGAGVLEAGQ